MNSSFLNKESLVPYAEPSVPAEFRDDFSEAIRLSQRYVESGDPASLDRNVKLLERIWTHPRFSRTSPDFRALIFNEGGSALNRRYVLSGNSQDLDLALDCWEEAVRLASPGRLLLCSLNNLATGLRAQYFQSGDRTKLNRAIEVLKEAIEQTEEDSPDLAARLNNLGNALNTRWETVGDSRDLDEGLIAVERAVHLTHIYSPDLPVRLNNLARVYLHRYERFLNFDDLNQAIDMFEQALRFSTPGSFDLALFLGGLGLALLCRYQHDNHPEDLQKAISCFEEAIRRCPDNAPEKSMYFNDLAIALEARYDRTANLEDLLLAMEKLEKLVHGTPALSTELPRHLNNLALALRRVYLRTGRLELLEKAITVGKQAVDHSPSDSPERAARLSNLADSLGDRYARKVELSDLEQAIRLYEEALPKASAGKADPAFILNSLALALQDFAQATHDWQATDRAVETLKKALNATPPKAVHRPLYLNNLATLFSERHAMLRDRTDLEQSVALAEEAVALTAPDSTKGPMFRLNLAENLHSRYLMTKDVDLLRKAISVCDEAAKHTAPDLPLLPRLLGARGRLQMEQYALTNSEEDLRKAIELYENALALIGKSFMLSPPIYQLGSPQSDLLAVHAGAMLALLKAAIAWPSEAAKWTMKAMAVVEATKSRLLTTLLRRRSIPIPSTIPDALVQRERALVEELALLETQALARHSLPPPNEMAGVEDSPFQAIRMVAPGRSHNVRDPADEPDYLHRWTSRHQALQEVLQEMERHESARDYIDLSRGEYLSPKEIASLASDLGETTALLSLAVDPEVTRLFAISSGWTKPYVSEIRLEPTQWTNLLSRFVKEIHSFDGSGRRGETWSEILQPLLAELTPLMEKIKHVVFIPHRTTHLLPWARLAVGAGWEVSVSSIPALGLLDRIVRHSEPPLPSSDVLVVGNPLGDLPHAASEAMKIAELFETIPLIGGLANKVNVLYRLEQAQVGLAHFATHAYLASDSPLDSGVVLADGVLTAREILEHGLRVPQFVVLSACESGLTKAIAGEEMAGLSQAFIAAGARSQVLSLWVVNDPATEHLMTGFYREWMAGKDKASALMKAMAATRTALPAWAHSYYWGAFTLVGDWRSHPVQDVTYRYEAE